MENKKILNLIGTILNEINNLDDKEIEDIINGDIKIYFKKKNIEKRKEDKSFLHKNNLNWNEEIKKLYKCKDRDEGKNYIKSLKLTNKNLLKLGKILGINIPLKSRKEEIINKIVDDTIGVILKSNVLRNEMK